MLIVFIIYAIIPIILLLKLGKIIEPKIKKCRILYSIPAILLTGFNIVAGIYLYGTDQWSKLEDPSAFFIPGIFLLITIVIYNLGHKQEKIMQAELAEKAIEKVRYSKKSQGQSQIVIKSTDEIEKL